MTLESQVRARLDAIRARVEQAAKRAGRDPSGISLVGVAKRQPPERVAAAVRAGLRELGENYVQESRALLSRLHALLEEQELNQLRWHLVGRLQRNKAREVARRFDVVHSIDRAELAVELNRRAAAAKRRLEILLQVNLSGEPQKGGVAPQALGELVERCAPLRNLQLAGLMTLPAESPDPEASRDTFAKLRKLAEALRAEAPGAAGLRELSMGMSADFEVAVEEGATLVRIGTAIFGPRREQTQ